MSQFTCAKCTGWNQCEDCAVREREYKNSLEIQRLQADAAAEAQRRKHEGLSPAMLDNIATAKLEPHAHGTAKLVCSVCHVEYTSTTMCDCPPSD